MNLNVTPKPQYAAPLKSWLKIATRGLCPDAETRARREITEHFCAAVEEHISRGATFDVAAEHAHRALGSPRAARRRLLRSDLSHHEANIVAHMNGAPAYGAEPVLSRATRQTMSAVSIAFLACAYMTGYFGLSGPVLANPDTIQWGMHWTMVLVLTAGNAHLLLPRPESEDVALASLVPRLRGVARLQSLLGVGIAPLTVVNAAHLIEHYRANGQLRLLGKPEAAFLIQLVFVGLLLTTLVNTRAMIRKLAKAEGPATL